MEADVEHLRPLQPLERPRALVDAEQEVAAPLRHEDRGRDRPELRDARARSGPRPHRRRVAREGGQCQRSERGISARVGDRAREPGDEAGLHETLRRERGEEIRPRLDGDHRGPRNACDERVEDRAAAVGDAPGADLRVGDVRPCGQPVVDRTRVRDLARAVDPDEAAGLSVASCVEGEDGVALSRQPVALDQGVHLLAVAREPVKEHERRPASGRRRAVGEVERRGDRRAVVHRDREVLLRSGGAGGLAAGEDECGRQRREDDLHHGAQG